VSVDPLLYQLAIVWNVVVMLCLTVIALVRGLCHWSVDIRLREILRDSMPRMTNADEARPQIPVAVLSLRSLHLLQMATICEVL
jgi:hypothetical protein